MLSKAIEKEMDFVKESVERCLAAAFIWVFSPEMGGLELWLEMFSKGDCDLMSLWRGILFPLEFCVIFQN